MYKRQNINKQIFLNNYNLYQNHNIIFTILIIWFLSKLIFSYFFYLHQNKNCFVWICHKSYNINDFLPYFMENSQQ